jgi:hypothetical protein
VVPERALRRQVGVVCARSLEGEDGLDAELAFGRELFHRAAPPFGHLAPFGPPLVIGHLVAREIDRKGHDLAGLRIENVGQEFFDIQHGSLHSVAGAQNCTPAAAVLSCAS